MDVGTEENESALRAHIRKLLLRYSLTHLTINYVTYTRTEVSELLSDCLNAVPLDDPTFIVLPVDPFETLCKNLQIKDQKSYDQTWNMDDESCQYISTALGTGKDRERPTDRYWRTDETTYTNPYRCTTPILTTRAICQTPRLGSSSSSALIRSFTRCDSKYLECFNIQQVPDVAFEEVAITAREQDHILQIRPNLSPDTLGVVESLLASVQFQPKSPRDIPSIASRFLSNDASPPPVTFPCPMSPPIFPRRYNESSRRGMEKLSEISSLGFVAPVEVKDEEVEDMSNAHMLIVDGWSVMAPPPTSQRASSNTPSLEAGSQSSQMEVDELFALTPPQQLLTGLITDKKMEEYLVPRNLKPGGGKKRLEESKQTIATFLPPLLPPPVLMNIEPTAPDITIHHPNHSSPVSLSILGQPPSPTKSCATNQFIVEEDAPFNVGLDSLITQICAPVHGKSAEDLIMLERIEEKEALMMDVPKLKEPYLRPSSPSCPILPTSVRSLFSSKKHKTEDTIPNMSLISLKKVTGVQSLNIELTWRPFNFGTSIPTTEELADVERHPMLNSQSGLNPVDHDAENELKELLALEESKTDSGSSLRAGLCDEPPIDWKVNLGEDWGRYDVILTRAERRRVSGHQELRVYDVEDSKTTNQTLEDSLGSEESPSSIRPHKRRKVVPTLGPNLMDDSGGQHDFAPVRDCGDGLRFSFNTLCSPAQDLHSQPISEDAPYWNNAGDVTEAESLQVGGSAFLDNHSDPIWTVETAAQSLLGEHQAHVTPISAGTFVGRQSPSPSIAQDLYPRQESPTQPGESVNPTTLSSAVLVVSKPASRLSTTCRSETASAREQLCDFMKLRGKAAQETVTVLSSQPEPEPELPVDVTPSPRRPVPAELTDTNTLTLSDEWISPSSQHRYIASLDVLQKTILLKHLTSLDCNVELVERDSRATNGADLIIDSNTALLFVPLAPLAVNNEALAEKVAKLSWGFACLVLVFEAFSTSLSYRSDKTGSGTVLTPYAFPPAIVKALRKLKRTLAILDGMVTGNKRKDMKVRYAYARDVVEAARLARLAGDMAENASAATVMLGDSREWLTDDPHEDEMNLAQIKGMNLYSAAMILHHVDFNTFIDMESGDRLEMFSPLVEAQRITMLNEVIADRLSHAANSSWPLLSPTTHSTPSSYEPVPDVFMEDSYYADGHVKITGERVTPNHRAIQALEFMDDSNYGDGCVEMAGERKNSNYHRAGQDVQDEDDALDWTTTGLLLIPGKGEPVPRDDPVNYSF